MHTLVHYIIHPPGLQEKAKLPKQSRYDACRWLICDDILEQILEQLTKLHFKGILKFKLHNKGIY